MLILGVLNLDTPLELLGVYSCFHRYHEYGGGVTAQNSVLSLLECRIRRFGLQVVIHSLLVHAVFFSLFGIRCASTSGSSLISNILSPETRTAQIKTQCGSFLDPVQYSNLFVL